MNKDSNNENASVGKVLLVLGVLFISVLIIILGVYSFTTLNSFSDELNSNLQGDLTVGTISDTVDVFIQDQTTELVDLYISYNIANITLTSNTAIDDKNITFDSTVTPVIGNLVCLKENTAFYQGFITNVVSNGGVSYTVTLDSPLDYPYTTAGGCSIREHDMAGVDGSTTPIVYSLTPMGLQDGIQWDIVRLMFYAAGDSAMDDGQFGNIPALTNGVVVRKKDGVYKNLFNIKTTGEFAQRAYDVRYAEESRPPSGTEYTMTTRRTFGGQNKNGIVIRLDSETEDELQVIIQDDLTGLDHFHVIAQGHVVD